MLAKLNIDTTQFEKGVNSVSKTTGKAKKEMSKMDKAIAGFALSSGLALVAGFKKSISAAAEFESTMANVSTLLSGDSTDAIKKLSDGFLEMTSRIPKSADELGAASYQAASAGFVDVADNLKIVEEAARLGIAGLGSTASATDTLTIAMNAFSIPAEDANKASDILFKTVKNGITDIDRISQGFGNMAGAAVGAGISFEDASAATAALSAVTGKTSESQNALRVAFSELTQTGGKFSKSLDDSGFSLDLLNEAIGEKGFVGGIEQMRDELGLSDIEIKNMFSSAEAGAAVFGLLTASNEGYNETLEAMTEGANAVDKAFADQEKTFKSQVQLIKNNVNRVFIELGSVILPKLTESVGFLSDKFNEFREMAADNTTVLGKLVQIVKDFLQPAIEELKKAYDEDLKPAIEENKEVLMDLVKIIGGAVMIVIAGVIVAIKGFITNLATLAKVFGHVLEVMGWFRDRSQGMRDVAVGAFNAIAGAVPGILDSVRGVVNSIVPQFERVVDAVRRVIEMIRGLNDAIRNIASGAIGKIGENIGNKARKLIPKFAGGVTNFSGGMAIVGEEGPELLNLPRGSDVIPNDRLPTGSQSSINIGNVTINKDTDIDVFTQRLALAMRLA